MKGSGGKAFCAGGDVRHLYDLKKANAPVEEITHFFKIEYILDYLMARLPPYIHNVSFLNGITMGGGVGISVHGRYRVGTEKTLFAMPETAIGFYTDVGGSYFLPRLKPYELGVYLALTGHRLKGTDCLHAGITTHFVENEKLEELESTLLSLGDVSEVPGCLERFATKPEPSSFSLSPYMNSIQKHFAFPTAEEIITSLQTEDTEFAKKALTTLQSVSPTSLKVKQLFVFLSYSLHFPIFF